jgi:hypothetical protein
VEHQEFQDKAIVVVQVQPTLSAVEVVVKVLLEAIMVQAHQ